MSYQGTGNNYVSHQIFFKTWGCYFRLDAGTFATMGVGSGFAIAAALVARDSLSSEKERVVCIQGDSAFGFSGMEFETACR